MSRRAIGAVGVFLVVGTLMGIQAEAAPLFSDAERAQITAFWNASGRYRVTVPTDMDKKGLWQVRLTPDGSAWFLKYQIAIGAAKAPPTQSPTAATVVPALAAWKTWVDAKLAFDRWQAQDIADRANGALNVGSAPTPNTLHPLPPPAPGPIPPDLLAAAGDPPAFANAVTPLQYTITFDDKDAYAYQDNVKVWQDAYAYYRFPQGTNNEGVPLRTMKDDELDPLFAAAGFTPSEQRIVKAVSILEGGFDAINTYDTGFVSIGFIQFITARDGNGSLLEVLEQERADAPTEYARDFHSLGIDVNDQHTLVVVDPATGVELTGADAVQKTIADKRLTAIWQKAGKRSMAFRVAQIKVAKSHYWPAADTFLIMVNGQTVTGKVSDVIRSEAGLATLLDRKVNRGKIDPFADVLTKVMTDHKLMSLAEVAPYEREIIAALKYRTDFLADKTLSQPHL